MKFLIITAALVAAAFAGPVFVMPENAGPAPVIIDEFAPVNPGPAFVEEYEQINVGPAIVDEAVNQFAVPLIQIVVNINSESHVIDVPNHPEVVAPLPTPIVVPEPIQIGTPVIPPAPVVVLPEALN